MHGLSLVLTVRWSGSEDSNLAVSALSLMNEVRAKESAGDDRLEDDDWLLISGSEYVDQSFCLPVLLLLGQFLLLLLVLDRNCW